MTTRGVHAARNAAAVGVGSRVLAEIDDTNLDEVLASFRTSFIATATNDANDGDTGVTPRTTARLREFPIGPLHDLVRRYARTTPLAVSGRYQELLYVLVSTLIVSPHDKVVSVIDFDGRFDPLRLLATSPIGEGTATDAQSPLAVQPADLDHVHILRPARGSTACILDCVTSMEEYMLYGPHQSRAREWWGTVVIGGGLNSGGNVSAAVSAHVAVTAGWKGWLRVDRADVPGFGDMSVEEALAGRDKRQASVEDAGWGATSPWGGFVICRPRQNRELEHRRHGRRPVPPVPAVDFDPPGLDRLAGF